MARRFTGDCGTSQRGITRHIATLPTVRCVTATRAEVRVFFGGKPMPNRKHPLTTRQSAALLFLFLLMPISMLAAQDDLATTEPKEASSLVVCYPFLSSWQQPALLVADDGVQLVKLKPGERAILSLAPGRHVIFGVVPQASKLSIKKFSKKERDWFLELHFSPGADTLYARLDYHFWGRHSYDLTLVPEEQLTTELQRTQPVQVRRIKAFDVVKPN